MIRKTIELEDPEMTRLLLGTGDRHLKKIRDAFGVQVVVRKDLLQVEGQESAVRKGILVFQEMLGAIRYSGGLEDTDVDQALRRAFDGHTGEGNPVQGSWRIGAGRLLAGKVKTKTSGQERYIRAIEENEVVFTIGPAGSGKTYLAVAMAVEAMARELVHRLILVRPAVEAGESLGFLPGDLLEKVNPYLRPLYDSLHDLLNPAQVNRLMERGVIEVAPLAFMRGRTLNNAFVILDEAQNTTPKQMKMFLTRLGARSRTVINGDVTQVDLAQGELSGLVHAREVLRNIPGVAFVDLQTADIVRHPIVQRIVDAYQASEAAGGGHDPKPSPPESGRKAAVGGQGGERC